MVSRRRWTIALLLALALPAVAQHRHGAGKGDAAMAIDAAFAPSGGDSSPAA